WSTGVLLVVGVAVLAGAMVAAARSGNAEVAAKLGPTAAAGDWPALLGVAAQVTAASVALTALLPLVGLLIGIGLPPVADLIGLSRQFALGVLTALIAVPPGWA